MVETVERMIALEGAVNFRDLGGYEAGAGNRRVGARSSALMGWAS